jgi:peptide chain release factor subunit 1
MKLSRDIIRELAQLAETERTVLSVYLDMRKDKHEIKRFIERTSTRLRHLLNNNEKDHFETSLSFLEDFLKQRALDHRSEPGCAFFADIGADYTCGIDLNTAPEPLIAIDDEAIIHPLAFQLDEYEPIGIIMVDASCMRVLIAAGDTIENKDSLRAKIHHLSKVGGWSQMRYQRRRAKAVMHFSREIITKATSVFNDAGVNRIVIAGRDRMITALEKELPAAWQDKIIATIRWDLDKTDTDFLNKVKPLLEKAEREQEKDLLNILMRELRRDGLAKAGKEPVLKALKMGQVDTLFISAALSPELAEELTSRAQASNAYVEFIPASNQALMPFDNIAALLRFKI